MSKYFDIFHQHYKKADSLVSYTALLVDKYVNEHLSIYEETSPQHCTVLKNSILNANKFQTKPAIIWNCNFVFERLKWSWNMGNSKALLQVQAYSTKHNIVLYEFIKLLNIIVQIWQNIEKKKNPLTRNDYKLLAHIENSSTIKGNITKLMRSKAI